MGVWIKTVNDKSRIQWIDAAKGICMICIIAGHLGVRDINLIVYPFHLTIFFILSGYTLKQAPLDREFLNKKFRSIMVPYFITCFCVMVMDVVNSLLTGNTSIMDVTSEIAKDFARSFMASGTYTNIGSIEIGSAIGAIWFLPALFFALIFALILINRVRSAAWRFIIAFGLFVAACISPKIIWLPFSIQSAMMAVFFILIGYELRQRPQIFENFDWKRCLCALAIFVLCLLLGKTRIYYVRAYVDDIFLSLISALSMSMVVLYCVRHFLEKVKPLAWIGRNSLLFLCCHLFALQTMEQWFEKWLARFSIDYTEFPRFCINLAFALGGIAVINLLRRCYLYLRERRTAVVPELGEAAKERNLSAGGIVKGGNLSPGGAVKGGNFSAAGVAPAQGMVSADGRNIPVDIARGILIVLMLAGHFSDLDPTFRTIIYSFHMMAFVLLSGYFFSPESCRNIKKSIVHLMKTFLIPYAVFAVIYICMHGGGIAAVRTVLLGISYTDRILGGQKSVGPVYFILMLFVVRLIYLLLRKAVPNEMWMHAICLGMSVFGAWLGIRGYWLPWSVDCALYALIFYHLGYCFRKYSVMDFFRNNPVTYFVLSVVWAFMIYSGGMELSIRNYGSYGLVVLGAVSGSVLLFQVSSYLARTLPRWAECLMQDLGKSTLYILILITLFSGYFNRFVGRRFGEGYIYHMAITIVLELIVGMLVWLAVSRVERACAARVRR